MSACFLSSIVYLSCIFLYFFYTSLIITQANARQIFLFSFSKTPFYIKKIKRKIQKSQRQKSKKSATKKMSGLTPEIQLLLAQFKKHSNKAILHTLVSTLSAVKLREIFKAKKTKQLTWTKFCQRYFGVERTTIAARIRTQATMMPHYLAKEVRLERLQESEEENEQAFATFLELTNTACANNWIDYEDWPAIVAQTQSIIAANLAVEEAEEQEILQAFSPFSTPRKRKNCVGCFPQEEEPALPSKARNSMLISSNSDTDSSSTSNEEEEEGDGQETTTTAAYIHRNAAIVERVPEDTPPNTDGIAELVEAEEDPTNTSINTEDTTAVELKADIEEVIQEVRTLVKEINVDLVRDIIQRLCRMQQVYC